MQLAQKVILVTGGGSGIGRELVLELLRRGARVAAVDRDAQSLQETFALAQTSSNSLALFTADVSSRDEITSLPDKVESQLGPVDGVINCAGVIQPFLRVLDLSEADMDRVFRINWWGPLFLIKTFLPRLLRRPVAHIVNVSSMGGFLPVPGQSVYGASKAALKLFTEALYAELKGSPVRVTVVFPGAIATNIVVNSGVQLPKMERTQKQYPAYPATRAARDILKAVEKDQFRVLVGRDAQLMDLLYRLSPRRATEWIAKKMQDLLG